AAAEHRRLPRRGERGSDQVADQPDRAADLGGAGAGGGLRGDQHVPAAVRPDRGGGGRRLMLAGLTSRRTAIGLDVGARLVKAAQLRRRGATWRLEAAAVFPRTKPGEKVGAEEAAR